MMMVTVMNYIARAFCLLLIKFGTIGTIQMCAGLFHEIQVPEELRKDSEF